MKSYFAYIRVSTVRQGEKGSSLHEQRDAILAYARRQGLAIAQWFEEMETAAKSGRRQFSRMLTLLDQGKADGVVLHKIDRGARNLKDWADLRALTEKGTEVHFAHESLDITTRGGALSADIQAVIAADYIRNLRDEVRKGFYGRLKQGLFPLPAPVGYLNRGGGRRKELDPAVAPLIREAFKLYATGEWTLEALCKEIARRGLRTKHGGELDARRLWEILTNPFYIGIIRIQRTGETFAGVHEPLVPVDLFKRVEAVRKGRAVQRATVHEFLFRRLIRCCRCGYALTGEYQKGHVYYRCHKPACPTKCLREETIDEGIRETLARLRFADEELAVLREKALHLKRDWSSSKEEHVRALKLRLGQVDTRLHRLTDAYVDGLIDRGTFDHRNAPLLVEKRSIQDRLGSLERDAFSVPDEIARFLELAQMALLSYESGNTDEKRQTLRAVTSNLCGSDENIVIALRSPFREVANRSEMSNGGPLYNEVRTEDILSSLFSIITKECSAGNE